MVLGGLALLDHAFVGPLVPLVCFLTSGPACGPIWTGMGPYTILYGFYIVVYGVFVVVMWLYT